MTYVIAEPCINTKDTACVEVCPVDCIHPTKESEEFEKETLIEATLYKKDDAEKDPALK